MIGLRVFYKDKRIFRCQRKTNIKRFQKKFGPIPVVAVKIWEDLQTTNNPDAYVQPEALKPDFFLMALNQLRKYPTEADREGDWDLSPKTTRKWVWYYVDRLRELKYEKIVWPEDWGADIWVVTVDGTHCWINEPNHPEFSQDSKYYSHKFAKASISWSFVCPSHCPILTLFLSHSHPHPLKAGINYELGVSISSSHLVWMNGPFRAGTNDARIFRDGGLREQLEADGKKAIGDRGYNGYHAQCSTYNAHDRKQVRKFKSRALKRHETFNFMTKRYKCLDGRFRHGVSRFAACFEAVCVICQYEVEHNMPLFDVLIEDIM